jgi:molybdopterin biosynthesis enzyme
MVETGKVYGYYAGETILAQRDYPDTDVSLVDGYAIRPSENPKGSYILSRRINPRSVGEYALTAGEAVAVDTGFPVLHPTYAVVPYEHTRLAGKGTIILEHVPSRGENIAFKGTDIRRNTVIAREGMRLHGGLVKILIDLGIYSVRVHRKPRVAVYGAGSELCDPSVEGCRGKPSSTRHMIARVLEEYGDLIGRNKILPDDRDVISRELRSMMNSMDLIVTIGGTGEGGKDYVRRILEELPCKVRWFFYTGSAREKDHELYYKLWGSYCSTPRSSSGRYNRPLPHYNTLRFISSRRRVIMADAPRLLAEESFWGV